MGRLKHAQESMKASSDLGVRTGSRVVGKHKRSRTLSKSSSHPHVWFPGTFREVMAILGIMAGMVVVVVQ